MEKSWEKGKHENVLEKSWKLSSNTYEIKTEYFWHDLYPP